MNFNFELILFYAVVICGVIALFDMLFFSRKRKRAYTETTKNLINPPEFKYPLIVDYARSFFPILLLVFLLRSFLYEPFRIPTGSLTPSLLIGDFLLVNKFDYGVRLPVIHTKVFKTGEPQRGDIIVFRYPPNPSVLYIKRTIGLPGDHIDYVDKVLFVNGKKVSQDFNRYAISKEDEGATFNVVEKTEDLFGVKHLIFQHPQQPSYDFKDVVVPEGMYFMMGDNRDSSDDSRVWGFVPDGNIVGKAVMVWMSWDQFADSLTQKIRWNRVGMRVV